MNIRNKLVFAFLGIAIISIVIVSTLVYITVKGNLADEITSKIHLAVEEKEYALLTLLETQLANIQYLAQDSTVVELAGKMVNAYGTSSKKDQQDAYRKLTEHLINFADFYGGSGLEGGTYADVMVADLTGYMWIGTYGPDEGGNEADTEWFNIGREALYLGNIEYNPSMVQTTQIAAIPIKDEKGTVLAVLQLETNIIAINYILEHREGLGNTGEFYIVGVDNVMLTKSRFDPDAQGKLEVNTASIKKALQKKADITMASYKNYRGKYVVGSVHVFSHSLDIKYKKIESLLTNLGWLIVGETEEAEAYAPLIKLRNRIILIGIIISALVVLISLAISRSISAPIRTLKEATTKIANGQLDERVEIKSKDEFGDLAASFNKMTDHLQETTVSRDMLSKEVIERKQTEEALKKSHKNLATAVEELEMRNSESKILSEMYDMLQSSMTSKEAYAIVTKTAQQLFQDKEGALYILSASRNVSAIVASWGDFKNGCEPEKSNYDECLALRRGQIHLVKDQTTGFPCEHRRQLPSGGYICVPLMVRGETLGVFYQQGGKESIAETTHRLAITMARHISLALANLKLNEKLHMQSIRDPLTGLFNRRYMEDSLERELHRAARKNNPLGIIMLDIDHFKQFNDTFGHAAGDKVLSELSGFLLKRVRKEDIVCRYGGEEFILILPEASLEKNIQRAEQLRKGIRHINLVHRGQALRVITLSLGVAVFPEHGSTTEAILEAADSALYSAKAKGRDQVVVAKV